MYVGNPLSLTIRNTENGTERSEEEEFAKGPLSILYQAVKNNTQVCGVIERLNH